MEEKIIGYFCPKHGFYKEEPFKCQICGIEAKPHIQTPPTPAGESRVCERYKNVYIYMNKMKEVTQANAQEMLGRGY
jgi:hypothetical protein